MVELGNEKIPEDKIDEVVDSMFQRAGFENKSAISFDEFQKVLKDYRDELNYMSLDMQCGWSSMYLWVVRYLIECNVNVVYHIIGKAADALYWRIHCCLGAFETKIRGYEPQAFEGLLTGAKNEAQKADAEAIIVAATGFQVHCKP